MTPDGGASWAAANSGLPGLYVSALAIDPSSPEVLFAGIAGSGIFKSRDGGRSWAAANAGLANPYPTALAIDPIAPSTVYAGVAGSEGVFKTTDGGSSWFRMDAGLPDFPNVRALALDPQFPATLYAGGDAAVLYKTTDGGRSWIPANAGISSDADIFVLLVDPESSSTVCAGTNRGFFRSADRGASWSLLGLENNFVYSLAVGSRSILYAGTDGGVFESRDGGNTWVSINAGLSGQIVQSLGIDPASSSNIYVGTPSSFFATVDGGATVERNAGLDSTGVVEMHIDPVSSSTVYAVSGSGKAFKTGDGGLSWAVLPIVASVRSLAIDPLMPSTLYVATDGGVFRSHDAGLSWITSNQGLTSLDVDQVLVAGSSHATVCAGVQGDVVFRSLDGGGSWAKTALPPKGLSDVLLAVDPRLASIFYVGVTDFYGFPHLLPVTTLFRTVNGGATWVDIGSLTFLGDLAIDPERPAMLYAVAFAQVWSGNVDAGGDWRPIGGLPAVALKLALDPARPSRVYAGTSGNGVFQADVEESSTRPVRPPPRTVRFRAPAQD